jgi:serine/threonine-protein kinase
VTAPIGLIVSDRVHAPALLGWLRPRLLLPSHLADGSAPELKAVFLHELAHFKSLDIPFNWLFAAIGVVHWFNPLAYLAAAGWARFMEEAADENAIRWMQSTSGVYGEILLKTLASCSSGPAPYGALAIGESIATLKRRIVMIRHHTTKSSRGFVAAAVVLIMGLLLALAPTLAVGADDPAAEKKAAGDAMQAWLTEIDAGAYAKSWSDSAQFFQQALTSEKWVAALTSVRTPLGKLVTRTLDSVAIQPAPAGGQLTGEVAIAQFDASFENMKYARETVSFQKESDGAWRAVGYYIKPR